MLNQKVGAQKEAGFFQTEFLIKSDSNKKVGKRYM
jgi:hypothetical protein